MFILYIQNKLFNKWIVMEFGTNEIYIENPSECIWMVPPTSYNCD